MTTFQAVIYSIIHGFAEFLPVGPGAHQVLVPYLLKWPVPPQAISGALALGAFLALLVYFRHDWASIISSGLQVIIFRKRPMTLDERMPIFILISTIPAVVAWYYLHESFYNYGSRPLFTALMLIVFSVPLWFSDSMSKKTKGMFDWNWFDSILVGLGEIFLLVTGGGRTLGAVSAGLIRNYSRETATKFAFFVAAPIIAGSAFRHLQSVDFHASMPATGTSWFTFIVTIVVTFLAALLAIGGLMRHVQRKGFGQYIVYRFLLATVVIVVFWVRSGKLF